MCHNFFNVFRSLLGDLAELRFSVLWQVILQATGQLLSVGVLVQFEPHRGA